MKILHVRSSIGFYGAEALIKGLAIEQQRRGDEVWVAGLLDERAPHTELLDRVSAKGVRVERVRSEGRAGQGVPLRLARLIRERGAQLLHVHDYKTTVLGLAAAWMARVPVVCTFHGEVNEGGAVALYQAAARAALRVYDGVVVVSSAQLGVFEDPWRRCRARFLPNAIDVEGWRAEVEALRASGRARAWREALGLGAQDVVVGTVGRLAEDKGHLLALDGVEAALRAEPRLAWVLAGDGPERPRIEAELARRGLGERVRLLGFVEDRARLYAGLDGLLLPSLREGLPMVVLEAMSASLPVLASPVGEVPGVVTEACGVLLDDRGEALTGALLRLARDGAQREAWGRGGCARARERHSIQALASRYEEELYRPALARGLWGAREEVRG